MPPLLQNAYASIQEEEKPTTIGDSTSNGMNVFYIWSDPSQISRASSSRISGDLCLSLHANFTREPTFDPNTGKLINMGSYVAITYYAVSPTGKIMTLEENDLLPRHLDNYCYGVDTPSAYLQHPGMEGNWTVYATAQWIAVSNPSSSQHGQNETLQDIHSNNATIFVKPALYSGGESTILLRVDGGDNGYHSLNLLDWSLDGKRILVSYSNNSAAGQEEAMIALMSPDGTQIRNLGLAEHFKYIIDAEFAPSDNNEILITGVTNNKIDNSSYATSFYKYDLQNGQLIQLPNIIGGSSAVWVKDTTDAHGGKDKIVFGKEIRENQTQTPLDAYEIWLSDSDGSIVKRLYQDASPKNVTSFRIEDSNIDGSKILLTIYKQTGFPIIVNDLGVFDMRSQKMNVMRQSDSIQSPMFSPSGDLIIYDIAGGYKTPGGPMKITTLDGNYEEDLLVGNRNITKDYAFPVNQVASPDGKCIVAVLSIWGSGNQILTKTSLIHPIPEFATPSLAAFIVAVAIAGSIIFYKIKYLGSALNEFIQKE
ncbi:MAG TPA: hypothetical protein VHA09_06870 [Nitrososphaera sp.]|nr:hypothetical protein [Nitrososphaera sp.]